MNLRTGVRPTVLVTVRLVPEAERRLAQFAEVDSRPGLPPQEAAHALKSADALIVGPDWVFVEGQLDGARHLSVIGTLGPGEDPGGYAEAAANGLAVIRGLNPVVVAQTEQVMARLLALANPQRSDGLAGKTFGMIGFGPVGREVAKRGRAFGLRMLANASEGVFGETRDLGAQLSDLPDLLLRAEFLFVEAPEGDRGTKLGAREFSMCRAGMHLMSVGGLERLDTRAMLKALDGGKLGSAFIVAGPDKRLPFPDGWHPRLQVAQRPRHGWSELEAQSQLALVNEVVARLGAPPRDETLTLQVVPLEKVLPHENTDPERVAELIQRFESEATLINPPLVTPTEAGHVLLDGATRHAALKALGFPYLVVQLVDSRNPELSLGTWNHAVQNLPQPDLIAILAALPGCDLVATTPASLWPALERREALCAFITRDRDAYIIRPQREGGGLSLLNDIVAAYTHAGTVKRLASVEFSALERKAPGFSALVRFPPFSLQDVIEATLQGHRIPQGITRFMVPGRILHLHADLERLRADEPLEAKRGWLRGLVAARYARHAVRYYPEPVTLMDE